MARKAPLQHRVEVGNTFDEIHSHVKPIPPGEDLDVGIRQSRYKTFYVSPFIDMAMRYHFRVSLTGKDVNLRILETDEDGPLLAATFVGRRRPPSTATLADAPIRQPFMTLKIIGATHYEAFRLWLEGIRLGRRPAPNGPAADATKPTLSHA